MEEACEKRTSNQLCTAEQVSLIIVNTRYKDGWDKKSQLAAFIPLSSRSV